MYKGKPSGFPSLVEVATKAANKHDQWTAMKRVVRGTPKVGEG